MGAPRQLGVVGPTAMVLALGCADSGAGSREAGGGGAITFGSTAGGDADGSGDPDDDDDGPTQGNGDSGADSGGAKFDLQATPDGGVAGCSEGEGGGFTFSHIWIANTDEGTVSKIDTQSGVERGRYATGPFHPDGSPSRTSVNQFGDAVVVNRYPGGITKVAATEAACVDKNGNGGIETSTGPDDVYAWDADECVLWYTDLPGAPDHDSGPRPVAWEGVAVDENGCPIAIPRVWVGYRAAANVGTFHRLDGSTGAIADTVMIPNWGADGSRPYGGAVNAAGDFWITSKSEFARAVKIDAVTLMWEDFHAPPAGSIYGMAVDQDGGVWGGRTSGGAVHYHADDDAWIEIDTPNVAKLRGIQIDRDGIAWAVGNEPCALVKIDALADTLIDDQIDLPGCLNPVGVSIDVEGYVWVVDMAAQLAYKIDPVSHDVMLTIEGLVSPYTYSDMTGAGLNLVINPPG